MKSIYRMEYAIFKFLNSTAYALGQLLNTIMHMTCLHGKVGYVF